mmetsp:Transcript_5817/g.16591  ORF Transcript_5817/g.16591 Transcript_5817/m.16591 type:complete len:268 (+) Transcript_5817:209-1012(+)
MTLWKWGLRDMLAVASTVQEAESWMKSLETTDSSVHARMPLSSLSEACLRASRICSLVTALPVLKVRSTMETSAVGTRIAIPVSFPASSGRTFPTALAAPVEAGIALLRAQRPALQSFPPLAGPSTTSWLAVLAWMVVMSPSTISNSTLRTLARGAKQLVVHEALEKTVCPLYWVLFTPITNMGASAEGAEMTTFLAPPFKCIEAFSMVVKIPVDSQTISAPALAQGISWGSRQEKNLMRTPFTTRLSPSTSTVPGNFPCTESYLNW